MIPRIIHYCWFGGKPLPSSAVKCINSWKKYLPGYEIKEWNEDNFDINIIPYTKEAYDAKKYAFVSDYARCWILYRYGGIYFDTDVEVVKSMDHILKKGNFLGKERGNPSISGGCEYVNPGLGLAVEKGNEMLKEALDIYAKTPFILDDGSLNTKTIVTTTTELLIKRGYQSSGELEKVAGWNLYPEDYFCPKNYYTGVIEITKNTCSIHHYDASWKSVSDKKKSRIIRILPSWVTKLIVKIKHTL